MVMFGITTKTIKLCKKCLTKLIKDFDTLVVLPTKEIANKTMKIRTLGHTLYSNDLKEFEHYLGFSIPQDYCDFLKHNNGGKFLDGYYIFFVENNHPILVDAFYGIDINDGLDLKVCYRDFSYDMPPKSLVIASTGGYGQLLLVCEESNEFQKGIYYWDDVYYLETSNDEDNCYFVATSFTEFIEKLRLDG